MADAGAAAAAVRADGRLAAAATREVKRGLAAAGEGTYPSTADLPAQHAGPDEGERESFDAYLHDSRERIFALSSPQWVRPRQK